MNGEEKLWAIGWISLATFLIVLTLSLTIKFHLKSINFNYLTMDTKGDNATLLYVDDSVGWVVVSNSGCTVNVPDTVGKTGPI